MSDNTRLFFAFELNPLPDCLDTNNDTLHHSVAGLHPRQLRVLLPKLLVERHLVLKGEEEIILTAQLPLEHRPRAVRLNGVIIINIRRATTVLSRAGSQRSHLISELLLTCNIFIQAQIFVLQDVCVEDHGLAKLWKAGRHIALLLSLSSCINIGTHLLFPTRVLAQRSRL